LILPGSDREVRGDPFLLGNHVKSVLDLTEKQGGKKAALG
jgi:hypothetical protein